MSKYRVISGPYFPIFGHISRSDNIKEWRLSCKHFFLPQIVNNDGACLLLFYDAKNVKDPFAHI